MYLLISIPHSISQVFKKFAATTLSMTEYVFSGEITQGRGRQPFERSIEADSMKHAKDKLYSSLCSEHSVKRTKISIEEEAEA